MITLGMGLGKFNCWCMAATRTFLPLCARYSYIYYACTFYFYFLACEANGRKNKYIIHSSINGIASITFRSCSGRLSLNRNSYSAKRGSFFVGNCAGYLCLRMKTHRKHQCKKTSTHFNKPPVRKEEVVLFIQRRFGFNKNKCQFYKY